MIIRETNQWIALDKPHSWIVERNPFESPTVEEWLWEYLSKNHKKPFLGIVHRLDRVTSGVIVFAKKKQTLKQLNQQFAERTVKKVYRAWVEGVIQEDNSLVRHYLEKDFKNKKAIIHEKAVKKAKACSLTYKILQSEADKTHLEIHPTTGRFHQIRAQLSYLGHPILGDVKYGAQTEYAKNAIALQAHQLRFYDPLKEENITIESKRELGTIMHEK